MQTIFSQDAAPSQPASALSPQARLGASPAGGRAGSRATGGAGAAGGEENDAEYEGAGEEEEDDEGTLDDEEEKAAAAGENVKEEVDALMARTRTRLPSSALALIHSCVRKMSDDAQMA